MLSNALTTFINYLNNVALIKCREKTICIHAGIYIKIII